MFCNTKSIFVLAALAFINTICAQEDVVNNTVPIVPAPSAALPSATNVASHPVAPIANNVNNATIAVVPAPSNSTDSDAHADGPTVTEKIRTYIEDSVSTVKSAITTIGNFIGHLFNDKDEKKPDANNSTNIAPKVVVAPVVVVNSTAPAPAASNLAPSHVPVVEAAADVTVASASEAVGEAVQPSAEAPKSE